MSSKRRGFVLPTTLMVMTLLTVMLTAAFIIISAEFRTTDNSMAMSQAHALAQAGLQKYLTMNRGITPGTNSDSVRVTYAGGYADVVSTRLVAPDALGVALWIVRSSGYMTGNTLTGQTAARRTVAQLAQFNPGSLPLRAAFLAGHTVQIVGSGGAAPIDGQDACASSNVRDLTTATGDVLGDATGITLDGLGSRAAVLDSSHIDWASLLAGNFTPDYTLPSLPVWSGYPIGYGAGNHTLPGGGIGILVVSGDLTIPALTSWRGIVIVGGRVRAQGAVLSQVRGAVISGLNNLITPNSVGPDSIPRSLFSGYRNFQWDSCEAASAISFMASMAPLRNGYIDTWSTY